MIEEVERFVLSALIQDPPLIEKIEARYFLSSGARKIYESMHKLYSEYRTFDLITLVPQLNGYASILAEISSLPIIPALFNEYLKKMIDQKKKTEINTAIYDVCMVAQSDPEEAARLLTEKLNFINSASEKEESFPIIKADEVRISPVEYQIEKIWLDNSVGFISGQPGTFKTWLSLEIGISIASGTSAFGKYKAKQGRVLAFNAEDDPARITKLRIAAFAKSKAINLKNLDFNLINIPSLQVSDLNVKKRLEATIRNYKPAILIIDPLRNVHSLNEDKASEMSPLLDFFRIIQREHNCSVLLVCHDRKPSGDSSQRRESQTRGSNVLEGWRDNAIYLDRKENKVRVQIYHRGAQSPSPFFFKLNTKEQNRQLTEAYLDHISEGNIEFAERLQVISDIKNLIQKHGPGTRNQIISGLECRKSEVLKAINELIEKKEILEVAEGKKTLLRFPEPIDDDDFGIPLGTTREPVKQIS